LCADYSANYDNQYKLRGGMMKIKVSDLLKETRVFINDYPVKGDAEISVGTGKTLTIGLPIKVAKLFSERSLKSITPIGFLENFLKNPKEDAAVCCGPNLMISKNIAGKTVKQVKDFLSPVLGYRGRKTFYSLNSKIVRGNVRVRAGDFLEILPLAGKKG
jgi:hypothetical protein